MKKQSIIKLAAVFLGFASLVIALIDEQGGFRDRTRLDFAARILKPEENISPSTSGFSDFFDSFPAEGVTLRDVVKLRRDRLNNFDGFPVALTVRYVLTGDRVTAVVADKAEIESWAAESSYGFWSLIIAGAAFICVALLDMPEIVEEWRKRKRKAAEP
jgi:hypothetical protein